MVLDDATRFDRPILDSLRTVHDTKRITLHRGGTPAAETTAPADFRVVIGTRGRNLRGLSGPLLDRADIATETATDSTADPSALAAARAAQAERLAPFGVSTNAEAPAAVLLGDLHPGRDILARLDLALDRARVSLRGFSRILRVAWTLADLAGKTTPDAEDIEAARGLRRL